MKTRLYKNPPPNLIVLASSVKTKVVEVIEFHRICLLHMHICGRACDISASQHHGFMLCNSLLNIYKGFKTYTEKITFYRHHSLLDQRILSSGPVTRSQGPGRCSVVPGDRFIRRFAPAGYIVNNKSLIVSRDHDICGQLPPHSITRRIIICEQEIL